MPIAVVEGIVMPGKRVGRTLGVPTANLPHPGAGGPPNGVYVADVYFPDEKRPPEEGVLSQGDHPTVPGGGPTVEVFLLNCREDLYGRKLRVHYLHFLRPEVKFPDRESMRVRMQQDILDTKAYFAARVSP